MKATKIIFQGCIITLTFLLIVITGCKNSPVSPVSGLSTVSGTIMLNDKPTRKKLPLSGIKVYLININFKVDTVNYKNNSAAFVDSAVTDSTGKYTLANIKAGKYAVIPLPEPGGYQFSIVAGSDPDTLTTIDNAPKNYSVNFIAPNVGTVSGVFTIKFISKNVPALASGWKLLIGSERLRWVAFVPIPFPFDYRNDLLSPSDSLKAMEFTYSYGWTSLFYTLSNAFILEFSEVALDAQGNNNVYKNRWTAFIDLGLSISSGLAIVEIDWTAHTLKRIQ